MRESKTPILQIRHMHKTFGGTHALNDVSLDFYSGEVHALLGENGAGKSTLIKILCGVYSCTQGEMIYHGENIGLDVRKLNLAVIHQDLGLADDMTVTENIAAIAGYVKKGTLIDWKATRRQAEELLRMMDSSIDPDALVSTLSAADRSVVAISRALHKQIDIMILDEPTATLPAKEVDYLFALIEKLRSKGIAVIYVSHRMDEVFQITQRISVLRNGCFINSYLTNEVPNEQVIADIIGRDLAEVFIKTKSEKHGGTVMQVDQMVTGFVGPVSFELKKGEILALFGLIGAGHNEVGRCIWGVEPMEAGQVYIDGKPAKLGLPERAIAHRIGFITSKRQEEGIAPLFTLRENLYPNPTVNGKKLWSIIRESDEASRCMEAIRKYRIKATGSEDPVSTLSGGNQQKVMIARWFETDSDILILEDPTIGVDVGAKADIYNMMKQGLDLGLSIILISSDCEEVSRIAHRVLVFDKGEIVKEVADDQINMNYLTALSTGLVDE